MNLGKPPLSECCVDLLNPPDKPGTNRAPLSR
jgi:hypothetical protein